MITRTLAARVVACLLTIQCIPVSAHADNRMGYQLLSPQDAAALPHNQGALGLNVDRGQQITDGGMTFDIIRITQVRRDSTGARAGLKSGDEIIALDGKVFPSLVAFASYIGSTPPGNQIVVDYMPAGGGPQQAQRVAVLVGRAGQAAPVEGQRDAPPKSGLSTGEKIAIGAGAVALLGCYEMGCFSHRSTTPNTVRQPAPQPNVYQQNQQPGQFQPYQQPNGSQQR